jgi:hypothetical protein
MQPLHQPAFSYSLYLIIILNRTISARVGHWSEPGSYNQYTKLARGPAPSGEPLGGYTRGLY